MIIAFAGRKTAGKDTAARAVLDGHPGARSYAFADEIRRIAVRLWGLTWAQVTDQSLKEVVDPRWGKTPRHFLVTLGTEVGRTAHLDTWTRYLLDFVILEHNGPGVAVITDVRHESEVAAIHARGGVVIGVVRPGVTPYLASRWLRALRLWPTGYRAWCRWVRRDHDSESQCDVLDLDAVVINDGSVEQLQERVSSAVAQLLTTRVVAPSSGGVIRR